jgi:hypothetical protein
MSLSTKSIKALRLCASHGATVQLPPNELQSLCDLALREAAPTSTSVVDDRKAKSAFENCIVGDEVEARRDLRAFQPGKVVDRGGGSAMVVFSDGARQGFFHANNIRWPQSDAAKEPNDWRDFSAELEEKLQKAECTIAAKDAEICELRREAEVGCRNYKTLSADHERATKTIAELRAASTSLDHDVVKADVEVKTLRAQLSRAEGELSVANEKVAELEETLGSKWQRGAFEKYQHALGAIGRALNVDWGTTPLSKSEPLLLAAIATLKSESRLVLPAEVLARHPLPWMVVGVANVADARSAPIAEVETGTWANDTAIARLIVEAANRGASR